MKLTPFGKLVRQHRLEHEVTLLSMTEKIGVSAAFASAVETGTKKIPSDYPRKVADALNLDKEQFEELEKSASLSFNEVRISIARTASKSDREVVAMFARRFQDLPEDRKTNIRHLLEDNEIE